MKLRISLVQQSPVWQDAEANRARFEALLEPLASQTDLVLLPEMFTTGFTMDVRSVAEPVGGPTAQWLLGMARRLDAAVAGSIIAVEGGRYFNRLLWASPRGELHHYDKRHLFRMAEEHHHFSSGRSAVCLQWRGWRVCPLVCYDLRFPVFSRRRPGLDYDLLVYVASWPAARRHAWQQLLKARAIENLAFVAGVNRVGTDGKDIDHAGDSAVHDFLGKPIVEMGSEEGISTVELDGEALHAFRKRFPAHLDADRFELLP